MQLKLYQSDAFVVNNKPFTGNPATVCLLRYDNQINDEIKQKIASEVNQSMTAFVSHLWSESDSTNIKIIEKPTEENTSNFKIRFFTPTNEIDLCGHASVASARVLAKVIKNDSQNNIKIINFIFESKLKVKLEATIDLSSQRITLSMPSHVAKPIPSNDIWIENMVKNTLGPNLDNHSIVEQILISQKFLLIRLKDNSNENNVLKILPNFEKLKEINRNKYLSNGIIVTQKADFSREKVHFFSRVFLPFVGVNEDPVCGSAHTVLTPYWTQQLKIAQLIGKQCSQRTGLLYCTQNEDRILMSGNAVIVFEGLLCL